MDAALKLGDITIAGRTLKIQRAEKNSNTQAQNPSKNTKPNQPQNSTPATKTFNDKNTVFASNLPFKATDDEIKMLFKDVSSY